MEFNRVNQYLLSYRIDTHYYRKQFLEIEAHKLKLGIEKFKPLVSLTQWIRKGIFDMPASLYQEEGIPFIRISDFDDWSINIKECVSIPNWKHEEEKKTALIGGDLIMSKVGSIGYTVQVPKNISVNISQNVIGIKVNQSIDSSFLLAYLNNKFGKILIEREVTTIVQDKLTLDVIRELPVYLPIDIVQTYIGDKVRLAERLRERSQHLSKFVNLILEALIKGEVEEDELKAAQVSLEGGSRKLEQEIMDRLVSNEQNAYEKGLKIKSQRVSSNELITERLDADFYRPEYLNNSRFLRNCPLGIQTLNSIADRISCGPFGSDLPSSLYRDSGIPLYRVQNIRDGEVSDEGLVFLDQQTSLSLSKCRFNSGDILIAKSGILGRVAYVPLSVEVCNVTQDVIGVSINVKKADPQYIAAFLSSKIGRVQIIRWGQGNIQQHLNMPSVREFVWVCAERTVQTYIGDKVREVRVLKEIFPCLITAAKLLVEALIEGKLTEDELKTAQEALQKGDREPDKAILSRLTRKGYDIKGELPLFPDLDLLYQTIDQLNADEQGE